MWEIQVGEETIRVSEADMEAIRQAVLQLLASKEGEIYRFLAKELANYPLFPAEHARLGNWALTERKGELALVRIPPRSRTNHIFGATLTYDGGQWTATRFIKERMIMRMR